MSQPNEEFDWDAWLAQIPQHVEAITQRITSNQTEAARAAAKERRRKWLINPATGHTYGLELCWVCGAVPVHQSPTTPHFRACRFCIRFDRKQAAFLGLKMLLPLMNWPSQPELSDGDVPRDAWSQAVLEDIWCGVEVLDEWRRSCA